MMDATFFFVVFEKGIPILMHARHQKLLRSHSVRKAIENISKIFLKIFKEKLPCSEVFEEKII